MRLRWRQLRTVPQATKRIKSKISDVTKWPTGKYCSSSGNLVSIKTLTSDTSHQGWIPVVRVGSTKINIGMIPTYLQAASAFLRTTCENLEESGGTPNTVAGVSDGHARKKGAHVDDVLPVVLDLLSIW